MDKKLKENMPIYVQIMNRVREAIAAGELKPGDKIASVRDLAADFEVNPNTMQRALTELEREGLLLSERTQGRYVGCESHRRTAKRYRPAGGRLLQERNGCAGV